VHEKGNPVFSRRQFLTVTSSLAAAASVGVTADAASRTSVARTERVSLDGIWQFRLDPDDVGQTRNWEKAQALEGWSEVTVPHTWQTSPDSADYFGTAWYRRTFEVPRGASEQTVRVEFEAVFHSAVVWVNGREVGKHLRKGYTAFAFDITGFLYPAGKNVLVVRVDSSFDDNMLPRSRSSDWSPDGGIYRPVHLLMTPKVYVERVDVDAVPDLATKTGNLEVSVVMRNSGSHDFRGQISCDVIDQSTGLTVLHQSGPGGVSIPAGKTIHLTLPELRIANVRLWHFDAPNLYSLSVVLEGGESSHEFAASFGVRKIEIKQGSFWLNGERVRLMGVERMAGSNPDNGMAEPTSWIMHDHDDLKNLNCVFTRVHWPQDKRVLEYCDRHGILIQTEVPAWGPDTFKGMQDEPAAEIMQNGLEQLQEMIARDRNHPCIFSWGLCNEINGQNPPAYEFAKRMYEVAAKLDPRRLRSYASNSLQKNPEKDVSQWMDFIEWNEYYESWYRGTPEDLLRNLEQIHQAFPSKPIVISEYGYCACTPDRPEGDARRIEILREHTRVCREKEYIGGLIFFCYNDYRTHVGDKGSEVLKQRVHGVVDLLGARKPSYAALREESSPIEAFECTGNPGSFTIHVRTRKSVPVYTLLGYKVRGTLYGDGNIPLEQCEAALPPVKPGDSVSVSLRFKQPSAWRVEFDVIRPTGFSARTRTWTP
jgi:beta-galactosidase